MGFEKYILKQNAYTLLEIIIVIVIISALVSLAIPKYTTTLEKARLGEGLQIIEALYKAQQARFFERRSGMGKQRQYRRLYEQVSQGQKH